MLRRLLVQLADHVLRGLLARPHRAFHQAVHQRGPLSLGQWTRRKGSCSAGPYEVRMPGGKCAIIPPSDHGSADQSVSQ